MVFFEVLAGDLHLLLGDVARYVDHLHPVPQRLRDGVDGVGRAQEEYLGEVHRHVHVVVHEG